MQLIRAVLICSDEILTNSSFPIPDMPVVTLKMGSSLNPDDIKEGADVYFECLIQSNPKPYKMSWFHNVSRVHVPAS